MSEMNPIKGSSCFLEQGFFNVIAQY